MELFGGVMIMLFLLGLLFFAAWLSIPVLLAGIWRRQENLYKRMEKIESALISLAEKGNILETSDHDICHDNPDEK